ncbi:hypothetical protein ABKN59_011332 [Abortiporus biennis]
MAVISLPLTFQNSFWSQDYRKGLEVLYKQLEQGIAENEEIVAFIRARAAAEAAIGTALATPVPGHAFDVEDGASLQVAFKGLKDETLGQAKAHDTIAKDLRTKIADPFEEWAHGYRDRLYDSRITIVDGYLHAYEHATREVSHLKDVYLTKTRKADEAEDDARFAPVPTSADKYTTSPNLGPRDKRAPRAPPEIHFDADVEETRSPKVDKGKGRAVDVGSPARMASPPPMDEPLPPPRLDTANLPPPPSAPPIVMAGIEFAAQEIITMLTQAKAEMPLRPVRFPLLGEYQEAFTGEDFTNWLRASVKALDGDLDKAEAAAAVLVEKHNLLRRLGELGNEFEDSDEAWYQFRPKAFTLEVPKRDDGVASPIQNTLSPLAENVAKKTSGFASLVQKALAANPNAEPPFIRLRREAENADNDYRLAIRQLDRQRLGLEERIEDTLKSLQKWELDRLRAVKTVLLQYQKCVESLPQAIAPSMERSSTLIASYQPEADLKVLIEQYRTGPFRPTAQVYESIAHDESDVVFGIDLRKWLEIGTWTENGLEEKKDLVPPVLTSLLTALTEAYPKLPNDAEKRKTWIYDVPLPATHHLRETLNAVPFEQTIPDDALAKYDAPVIASAVKLWVLELDPPLCMYEGWDEFRKLYPTVGAVKGVAPTEEQHIQELQNALSKLPKVHLIVLDTVVKHLKDLIDSTAEGEEPNEVYITKLALGIGRAILRPKVETEFSIQDRHPTLLFIDLINKYAEILPPTISKKRETERRKPVRRRTRPVDMRMSRSRISAGADLAELHAQQLAQRGIVKPKSPPPMNIPSIAEVTERTASPAPAHPAASIVPPAPSEDLAPTVLSAEPEEFHEPPAPESTPSSPVPISQPVVPPPPTFANIPPPPPLASKPVETDPSLVPPTFKEPPPETDDFPPRPQFKEPPPEVDSDSELPMPNFPDHPPKAASPPPPSMTRPRFVDPPPEPPTPPAHIPSFTSSSQTPTPTASPPHGISRSGSPRTHSRSGSVSSNRSTSPQKPSGLSSQQDAARRRLNGPRASGGGSGTGTVGNMVKNFNRNSVGSASSPFASTGGVQSGRPASPGNVSRVIGTGRTHVKRSSASRTSAFERRTMASDAEEEIVQ